MTATFYVLLLHVPVLTRPVPIPVVVRSEALVCGRSLARMAGSNPAGDMDVCLVNVPCWVRGLWVGPNTRPEESHHRVWCD
jgi:hypothetical protein